MNLNMATTSRALRVGHTPDLERINLGTPRTDILDQNLAGRATHFIGRIGVGQIHPSKVSQETVKITPCMKSVATRMGHHEPFPGQMWIFTTTRTIIWKVSILVDAHISEG